MNKDKYAPVVLFVFNRIESTKKTIHHLKGNALAARSDLFIYSDGGKDNSTWKVVYELRDYLRTITGFKSVSIIERESNYYLEQNIIEGVTEILERYNRIIVLEDDVCVSPYFLNYMNDALALYEHQEQVMHISSINHFNLKASREYDAYFTTLMECSFGWGTWKNRWRSFKYFHSRADALSGLDSDDLRKIEYGGTFKCLHTLDYKPIPWDICWIIAIYKRNGLCLEPTVPLARNIGLYGGVHHPFMLKFIGRNRYDRPFVSREIRNFPVEIRQEKYMEHLLYNDFRGFGVKYNIIGCILRAIKRVFKKR